ncbi:Phosphatidylinositide phosphatase SAC1 [Fasciolopsis buskii]|uniref:Phosphatidylinositol-3-phosphatase SAC1 n=1 Tax=Fasciolopsis buskii TaxID=27845 RepID=A0A8E0RY47_9TREM|nr:Phosphatidylinositide phosphatase SAC1 [Fasciolopsis buski]
MENTCCKPVTLFLIHPRFASPEAYYLVPVGGKEVLVIDRVSQEIRIECYYLLAITGREKLQDEKVYCQMLETVLNIEGFYYSTTYDLTHTQQRLADTSPEFKSKSPFERCDPRFTWNHFLLSSWSDQLADCASRYGKEVLTIPSTWNKFDYCLPVIQGFVGIIDNPQGQVQNEKQTTTYALISRRSVDRVGTRYNSRGVDQRGNATNTVETEQIFDMNGNRFSFVQLRGSVPLYWSQRPNLRYKPKVLLGGSQLSFFSGASDLGFGPGVRIDEAGLANVQSAITRTHFNHLVYTYGYGRQIVVNLLDQKGLERPLNRAYATATTDLDENEVKYEGFDFHRECGSMRWDRLTILLERLIPELDAAKQFHLIVNGSVVKTIQTGTFRTNCIDCLDRTNVVQSMLGWCALEHALVTLGVLDSSARSSSASASSTSVLAQRWPSFGPKFREVWADNADYCSLQYTGTRALKTDFTRTGKRTFYGMLMDGYNSIVRYYMNNFTDGFRQDAMHLFLGQYLVHEADGTPKPLTGPGGRGRRGSGNADTEWRTQFLPLVFTFAMAMSVLCVIVPTAHWTEQVTYVLFWGTASVLSAFAIFAYGEEFVDRPRFCPD